MRRSVSSTAGRVAVNALQRDGDRGGFAASAGRSGPSPASQLESPEGVCEAGDVTASVVSPTF
ncbi:MAG: hypothetical protein QOG53_2750 [Frankiales bacterium]|jgi:hypothetical protein|nr:hypothetical protein [Frankiales bacterium]